jgi:hypothetical protein
MANGRLIAPVWIGAGVNESIGRLGSWKASDSSNKKAAWSPPPPIEGGGAPPRGGGASSKRRTLGPGRGRALAAGSCPLGGISIPAGSIFVLLDSTAPTGQHCH